VISLWCSCVESHLNSPPAPRSIVLAASEERGRALEHRTRFSKVHHPAQSCDASSATHLHHVSAVLDVAELHTASLTYLVHATGNTSIAIDEASRHCRHLSLIPAHQHMVWRTDIVMASSGSLPMLRASTRRRRRQGNVSASTRPSELHAQFNESAHLSPSAHTRR
jgi:hypothetical protein